MPFSILKESERIALSDKDIINALDGKTNIEPYHNLKNYASLYTLTAAHGNAIILYEFANTNIGHWIAVILHEREGLIEIFDSYGLKPDEELKGNAELTFMIHKAMNDGWRVSYNNVQLQSEKYSVNTCGRWCIARVMFKKLKNSEFIDFVNKSYNDIKHVDDMITLMTINVHV